MICSNGRISDRSFRRYRWSGQLHCTTRRMLAQLTVFAQSGDARRIIALGASGKARAVTGSLANGRQNCPGAGNDASSWEGLPSGSAPRRAGVTAPIAEEEIAGRVFSRLRPGLPDLVRSILAPRHERVPEVERLHERSRGRSAIAEPATHAKGKPVIILDTVGELARLCTGWPRWSSWVAACCAHGGRIELGAARCVTKPVLFRSPTRAISATSAEAPAGGGGARQSADAGRGSRPTCARYWRSRTHGPGHGRSGLPGGDPAAGRGAGHAWSWSRQVIWWREERRATLWRSGETASRRASE